MVNLDATVQKKVKNIDVELENLTQDIPVGMSCSVIYAFSPRAKVQLLPNDNYLITITDKYGTTTAEVTNVTEQNIERFINSYFQHSGILQEYIHEHNISDQAHADIRQLIQQVAQQATRVTASQINGNIIVDNQQVAVYRLPNSVLHDSDVLILDCGHADTNYTI